MDGDAFFVGVEVAKDQRLKNLPVVTGAERGIVSALSYEAKSMGITRGMPIFRVKKFYPSVIVLPGDYESYAHYSNLMFDVVRRYADEVEEYSIDECFADLTGLEPPLKMTYRQIAERIKKEVNDELKLSVTLALAPTKVLAKVGSKWVKPNGLTVITRDTTNEYLLGTPIASVWGIGPRTAVQLNREGIMTAKDFVDKDAEWVRCRYAKPYQVIWNELRCIYINKIDARVKTAFSSIQKTHTFYPPTNDANFLFSQLSKNIEGACAKSRRYGLVPKKINIFLKSQGFEYATCDIALPVETASPEVLVSLVQNNLKKIHQQGILYRTTGVTLVGLHSAETSQASLFAQVTHDSTKFETIHRQIDALEKKLGKRVVHLASTHSAINQKKLGTESADSERDLLFL